MVAEFVECEAPARVSPGLRWEQVAERTWVLCKDGEPYRGEVDESESCA